VRGEAREEGERGIHVTKATPLTVVVAEYAKAEGDGASEISDCQAPDRGPRHSVLHVVTCKNDRTINKIKTKTKKNKAQITELISSSKSTSQRTNSCQCPFTERNSFARIRRINALNKKLIQNIFFFLFFCFFVFLFLIYFIVLLLFFEINLLRGGDPHHSVRGNGYRWRLDSGHL